MWSTRSRRGSMECSASRIGATPTAHPGLITSAYSARTGARRGLRIQQAEGVAQVWRTSNAAPGLDQVKSELPAGRYWDAIIPGTSRRPFPTLALYDRRGARLAQRTGSRIQPDERQSSSVPGAEPDLTSWASRRQRRWRPSNHGAGNSAQFDDPTTGYAGDPDGKTFASRIHQRSGTFRSRRPTPLAGAGQVRSSARLDKAPTDLLPTPSGRGQAAGHRRRHGGPQRARPRACLVADYTNWMPRLNRAYARPASLTVNPSRCPRLRCRHHDVTGRAPANFATRRPARHAVKLHSDARAAARPPRPVICGGRRGKGSFS